jgi:hypothetical protein
MLFENASEVTEVYKYEYINSLSKEKEIITRANDINIGNQLSMLLHGYIMQQFSSNVKEEDIVAVDEPPESTATDTANLTDTSATVPLGKSKKDKEKALYKGEL